jgi:hypothetical protein
MTSRAARRARATRSGGRRRRARGEGGRAGDVAVLHPIGRTDLGSREQTTRSLYDLGQSC